MKAPGNVIRAFSEEHVERMTGLSKGQLRYWDRTGFFSPEYADDDRWRPYSRIYSFRNVVGLRTLGILRRVHKVPLQHLRQVAEKLSHLRDNLWTRAVLYVHNRRVVLHEEGTERLQDVVSGQYVIGLALKTVMSDVEAEARKLRDRETAKVGQLARNRHVAHNAWVIAGTRVPVRAIKRFHDAGYSVVEILKEYPDLTERDIAAALAHEGSAAA